MAMVFVAHCVSAVLQILCKNELHASRKNYKKNTSIQFLPKRRFMDKTQPHKTYFFKLHQMLQLGDAAQRQ